MLLTELLALNEAKAPFKLYVQEPYGNGFDTKPVKKGEMLPLEDGNEVKFIAVTADGKKVQVKIGDETKEMTAKALDGIILPAGESVKGRKGFAA